MAAGEVVGDGVLLVGDVGNPEVGGDIVEAEDVEAVDAEPHVAEAAQEGLAVVFVFVVQQAVAHADVRTAVGGGAEDHLLQTGVGRTEGEASGKGHLEGHLPAIGAGEVVGEEEVDAPTVVGGLRDGLAMQRHRGFHEGEGYPGVGAGDELAIDLEVGTDDVAAGFVATVIDNLHVVDVVRVEVVLQLPVEFGGELEGSVGDTELVLAA